MAALGARGLTTLFIFDELAVRPRFIYIQTLPPLEESSSLVTCVTSRLAKALSLEIVVDFFRLIIIRAISFKKLPKMRRIAGL